jgi:hypothetical protein
MLLALVSLCGSAAAVASGSIIALLAALLLMGMSARISMMAAILAGTHGKVAAREQGTASALLTASRQCGSAIGVAVLSAVLVVTSGSDAHRTAFTIRPAPEMLFSKKSTHAGGGQERVDTRSQSDSLIFPEYPGSIPQPSATSANRSSGRDKRRLALPAPHRRRQ